MKSKKEAKVTKGNFDGMDVVVKERKM